jgi:hypothetical protein
MDVQSSNMKKRKALSDANRLEIRKRNKTYPSAYQKDLGV